MAYIIALYCRNGREYMEYIYIYGIYIYNIYMGYIYIYGIYIYMGYTWDIHTYIFIYVHIINDFFSLEIGSSPGSSMT